MEGEAMERIAQALGGVRCGAAATEAELHAMIGAALAQAGIPAEHEARLGPRCRIDFLAGDVGVEIKKSRPDPARLKRQLARYAACPRVGQLLVIAPRGVDLPKSIGGKAVSQIALERLWGISLP